MLDGRLARLGGQDSAFGREFDSLADIVSFGVAPALMVYRIVLIDFPRVGWLVAFVYLVCGALASPAIIAFRLLGEPGTEKLSRAFRFPPLPA